MVEKDWLHYKIKNIARVIRGASPRPKGDKRYYGGDVPRLMVKDVTRDGKFVTPQVDFLTKEGEKLSRPCKKGTLTIVCSGTVGIPSFLAVDACIHDGFLALIEIDKNISNDYLYHQLSSLRNKFESSATHGGVFTNLTTSILEEFTVAFPPTKEEQSVIAESLSNIDELIQQLDYLIQKKKNIKQGAMQELLTGKRRLFGFSGKWEVVEIGNHIDLLTGFPFSSNYYSKNGIRLLRGSNIKRNHIDWSENITEYWEKLTPDLKKYVLEDGDIVIAMDGSLVGMSFARLSKKDLPALLLQRVARIRSNSINMDYLKEYVCSNYFTKYCDSVKTVTAIPHISPKDIRKFSIPVPPTKEEQSAIAKIISNMDTEIEKLEKNKEKYIMLKNGMMQKLLTGEIRVK